MKGYSNLTVAGNVTRDLEMRYTASGNPVVDVNLAVNSRRGGEDTVTWCQFTAWGKSAETLNEYLKKGDPVILGVRDVYINTYEKRDGSVGASLQGDVSQFTFVSVPQGQEGATSSASRYNRRPAAAAPAVENEDDVPW
jgi:single-strand DNA-binding protein